MKFSRILRLVESSGFLRYRVDISRNLRLVDLGRFLRFYFRFRFRAVYYKVFLLIIGASGKNLPAFLQHLAAFGGQMRIPRTTTCSVW